MHSSSKKESIIIGLYGVSGAGKSYLLEELRKKLGTTHYLFCEGSEVLDTVTPGGLMAFQQLTDVEKMTKRQEAIEKVRNDAKMSEKTAVVAGHYAFWNDVKDEAACVMTDADRAIFTHVLYLHLEPQTVALRRQSDQEKLRPVLTERQLDRWQESEIDGLRQACYETEIPFEVVRPGEDQIQVAIDFVHATQLDSELGNRQRLLEGLDKLCKEKAADWKQAFVLDADRTLAVEDSGVLFWQSSDKQAHYPSDPFKSLFSREGSCYNYATFRRATFLYEAMADANDFERICQKVAEQITIHPQFVSFLQILATRGDIRVIILTCGLQRVWELVLGQAGLTEHITVFGLKPFRQRFVITPQLKADVVARLQDDYDIPVSAFGDSPIDVPMLKVARRAFVVVGSTNSRSRTMDMVLEEAIESGQMAAKQILLPPNSPPRLDIMRLPLFDITELHQVQSLLGPALAEPDLLFKQHNQQIYMANQETAKLLATATRDANLQGPGLREAHTVVGRYLAQQILPSILGLEQYPIQHVQGHMTDGYRIRHESSTNILPLMRGGEPMAFGVSDVLPRAMFMHVKDPRDIEPRHMEGRLNVILVDSVINSGRTIAEFIGHIRKINATIRIILMSIVVQSQALENGTLARALHEHQNIYVVALRKSDNKYTGKGVTDTGGRLFNTISLE